MATTTNRPPQGRPPRTGGLPCGVLGRRSRGQALVEYLLMTSMLLFLFTGMYKLLQSNLRSYFRGAGQSILKAYY